MRRILAGAWIIGLFSIAGVAFAQTALPPGVTEAQMDAAFKDLSAIYGTPVVRLDQAKAICNEEQYIVDCATIGKKHDLFSDERTKQVDTLLIEFKGEAVEKLKQCGDAACLVEVATSIARRLNSGNPSVARAVDLTPTKVEEKRAIVETAKSLGVDIEACRTMDPDTASVELLRSCARLAKDKSVQKYIPQETKDRAEGADAAIALKEGLANGQVVCGDNTLEGCGNFCLAPSAEARAKGAIAIPPVCRQIASRFFGDGGVQELERAYTTVKETFDTLTERTQSVVFTTADGRALTDPPAIGKYLEEAGSRGDVEAVKRGMDFLVKQGFVTSQDRNFALAMVQKIKERGPVDFAVCRADPSRCADVVSDEDRGQFTVMSEIEKVMRGEMTKRGVADFSRCSSDATIGASCLEAARAALPQVELLAQKSPQAQQIVADIRQKIRFGEAGLEARSRVEERFKTGSFSVGGRSFGSFAELEAFCRTEPQQCLSETAREGIFSKDIAAERYTQVIEANYNSDSGNMQDGTRDFNAPNREETLRQYKQWLDNPQGPPPMPPGMNARPYAPYPQDSFYRPQNQRSCPFAAVMPTPCRAGEYRQESNNELGCHVYGSCIPFSTRTDTLRPDSPRTCPAMPTVESCPAGEEKTVAFSSPECGTYYGCQPVRRAESGITFPHTLSNGKVVLSLSEARAYCLANGVGSGIANECGEKFGVTYMNQPVGVDCRSRYGEGWRSPDSSGNCFNSAMTEYRASNGTLYACATFPAYGCATSDTPPPPPAGQREQVWNSAGLRSWIRSDASASRIESLKNACANVSSQANVWLPGAGSQSNTDFGMPDPGKCAVAASCASEQHFDGTSCKAQGTSQVCSAGQYWNGTSCASNTAGGMQKCFYPNASKNGAPTGYTVWCEKDYYNCHEGSPSGAAVGVTGLSLGAPSTCEIGWTGSTGSCPSGQYWDGTKCGTAEEGCVRAGGTWDRATSYCKTPGPTSCSAGTYWNGTSCVSSSASTCGSYVSQSSCVANSACNWNTSGNYCASNTTTTTCPSGQYWNGTSCISNTTTVTGSCSSELTGLLGSGCHSMGGGWFDGNMTKYVLSGSQTVRSCAVEYLSGCTGANTQTQTSCATGQYWNGSSCVPTSPTDCPSGQYWSGSACVPSSQTQTTCSSGQYWNGSACVTSTTQTDTASAQQGCANAGGTWNSASNYCNMPTTCPSGQYWNGSACATTSTTDTTTSAQQSCASAGGTWDSATSYCRMPSSSDSSYTPPSSGSYTPPSSGSYTPPAEGSYTAPPSGSYTPPPTTTQSAPISYLFCPDGHDWNGAYCTLSPPSPFERYTANVRSAFRSLLGI